MTAQGGLPGGELRAGGNGRAGGELRMDMLEPGPDAGRAAPAAHQAGAGGPAAPGASRPGDERLPPVSWPAWTGVAAPFLGFLLALIGGLVVYIPLVLAGVHISTTSPPPPLTLADTAVQDLAFVAAIVLLAAATAAPVSAWQFGLRRPRVGRRAALLAVPTVYVTFFVFDLFWALLVNVTEREKLLETLGANEGTLLLALSALLTCVLAPICEELLFRGYVFRALTNWRGAWPAAVLTGVLFGAAHAGSAPAIDLVPLGVLGLLLCLLYRWSGSLYPCIGVHCLNNAIAFGALEGWRWWKVLLLVVVAWALAGAVGLLLRAAHVITDDRGFRVGRGAA